MKHKSTRKMKRVTSHLKRMWETDVSLTVLLVFLLLYIFFIFPLGHFKLVSLLVNLFLPIILITGAIAATKNRILRAAVWSWSIIAFIFLLVMHWFPYHAFNIVNAILSIIFLVILSMLILGQAFREGPTTTHRILGSVAVYLLLGLMWSLAYYLIVLIVPDAFIFEEPFKPADLVTVRFELLYFSFISLTTIGYGDILPVHPAARTLSILEGVTGQLFPVILIARLVSLHVQTKQKKIKEE